MMPQRIVLPIRSLTLAGAACGLEFVMSSPETHGAPRMMSGVQTENAMDAGLAGTGASSGGRQDVSFPAPGARQPLRPGINCFSVALSGLSP